jgi:hypothetical protein
VIIELVSPDQHIPIGSSPPNVLALTASAAASISAA